MKWGLKSEWRKEGRRGCHACHHSPCVPSFYNIKQTSRERIEDPDQSRKTETVCVYVQAVDEQNKNKSWETRLLECKEIKPVSSKGNQSWIVIRSADAEAETAILRPPDAKNWLLGKDPDAGKDWRLEEKGTTEGEMFGWHHWLDGHEFEQSPAVGDGQGSLMCCNLWGCKAWDTTEWLNWTDSKQNWEQMKSGSHPLTHAHPASALSLEATCVPPLPSGQLGEKKAFEL